MGRLLGTWFDAMKNPPERFVCTQYLLAQEIRLSTRLQQIDCLLQKVEVFLADTAMSNGLLECLRSLGVMSFQFLVEELGVGVPE